MKRLYIILALAILFVLPSEAVLKEANIDSTLSVLRLELTNYRNQLTARVVICSSNNKRLATPS